MSTSPTLSPRDLAAEPRWPGERTRALPGRCRGDLMASWGDNVARHFGAGAPGRVREHIGAPVRAVPRAPTKKDWLPVAAQVEVTEAIIDLFLDGDGEALYPLLADDARRGSSRASLALLRRLGPRTLFKMAPRAHRKVYDVGELTAEVGKRDARLAFRGAALFEHPTWRLLQLYAQRAALELADRDGEVSGELLGPEAFAVCVRW